MARLVLCVALLLAPVASALEPTFGFEAGAAAGVGPFRAAPSLGLSARVPLGKSRFSLTAAVNGWTLEESSGAPAASELATAVGGMISHRFTNQLVGTFALAPAFAVHDEFGRPWETRFGLMASPALEMSTRRRTLSLQAGVRAYAFPGETRVLASIGALYTFR